MFSKILIANRGEIACRVIRTARAMGVSSVAVYSDADAGAMHVAMADEAVHIGPALASESYLRADKIIDAALKMGAEAIHPGYGFLSENADFVDAVTKAGLVFIGPTADAIRAMGLKDAAKALMEKAGVPIVAGYHGSRQEPDFLAAQANEIGYPVLIKARAGGGGKGMRLVEAPRAFDAALEGAKREAIASFGDDAVLIEKYIEQPRHIEVQVFGDVHGNIVHLFERDCSLQRRHQKVIEEAPAPGMTEAVRAAMGKAAVDAARAVDYQGAGTVEFIVDGKGGLREDGFWFMEMNTRLQVEHPVSEAITGLDFVELQLRVAAGEPLPFAQEDLSIVGHAFEARIYAEDVPKGFLPSIGRLDHLVFPDDVRIDSAVREGDEITPHYDPMVAKVITHAGSRGAALRSLDRALAGCHVAGCVTNIEFLGDLARHVQFAAGDVDTGLIERDLAALTSVRAAPREVVVLASLASLELVERRPAFAGFRHWSKAKAYACLEHLGERIETHLTLDGDRVWFDESHVLVQALGGTSYRVEIDGIARKIDLVCGSAAITAFHKGRTYRFTVPDPFATAGEALGAGDVIVSPMPGLVKLVSGQEGSEVSAGDALVVLEAMKMEHTLTAPRDGKIAEISVAEGDQVQAGAVMLKLEELA